MLPGFPALRQIRSTTSGNPPSRMPPASAGNQALSSLSADFCCWSIPCTRTISAMISPFIAIGFGFFPRSQACHRQRNGLEQSLASGRIPGSALPPVSLPKDIGQEKHRHAGFGGANQVASQNTSLPGGEGFIPGRTSIIPRTALILTNFDKCPRSGSVS